MALQVWLPLNGNLNNQGLTNLTVTNSGATVDNNGKIGKCYNFDGTYISFNRPLPNPCSAFTVCGWVKLSTGYATNNGLHLISFETSYGRICISKDGMAVRVLLNYNGTTSATGSTATASSISANVWNHYAVTFDSGKINIYINGQLDNSYTVNISQVSITSSILKIGTYSTESSKGCANDVRIYDHALSPKEIEILSRGLVCHYPLNGGGRTNNNMISGTYRSDFSTTSTSVSDGKLCVGSGGNGTFSITTDTTCPVGKYSYNVLNNTAGNRDFQQANVPYVTGKKYTGSWWAKGSGTCLYRVWNVTKGTQEMGVTFTLTSEWKHYSHTFTANENMGTDNCTFHLGVTGASNINICGMKLEEGEQATPWIPNPIDDVYTAMGYNSTTEYDVSGYNYHGTRNNTFAWDINAARYSVSTIFNGSDNSIQIPFCQALGLTASGKTDYTWACWIYVSTLSSKGYATILGGQSGFEAETKYNSDGTPKLWAYSWGGNSYSYNLNEWVHIAATQNSTESKWYVNGKPAFTGSSVNVPYGNFFIGSWRNTNSQNFKGNVSDFRIYATVLSAAQVAELYNTAVSVANNGTLMGYELVEV